MHTLLADLVFLLHLGFIVFVVAGGLLIWRWPRLAWLHLPAVAWGAAVELFDWSCPLTPLEERLRGPDVTRPAGNDFIGRYLLPIVYPPELTSEVRLLLGLAVIVVNAALYGLARWGRRGHGRTR